LTRVGEALLAVSTIGWILRVLLGIAVALFIYVTGAAVIRKFKIEPDSEPDPDQVVEVNVRFRCTICGAEVVMTAAQDADAIDAPRHCREDMVPV
jgi:hypothetical protein